MQRSYFRIIVYVQIVLVAKCIVKYEIKIMNLFGMNLF